MATGSFAWNTPIAPMNARCRHYTAGRMVDEYVQTYSVSAGAPREGRMKQALSIRLFAHSWISDWNHGNAHFLRGLARELVRMGHQVRCYEEIDGWSLSNLVREGEAGLACDRRISPHLSGARCSLLPLRRDAWRRFSITNWRAPTWSDSRMECAAGGAGDSGAQDADGLSRALP